MRQRLISALKELSRDYYFLGALAVVIAFIIYKIPYLSLALYWDEAAVYGPGVLDMAEAGPSLWPGVLDPERSRGHPLVFYFLGGLWVKIFGFSTTTLHSFPLVMSAGILLLTYRIGKRIHGMVGLAGVVLMAIQPMFIAESGILLPETAVTLFTLASLDALLRRKFGWYALWASLLVLTKEPGIVFAGCFLGWHIVERWWLAPKPFFTRKFIIEVLLLLVPFAVLTAHFGINYLLFGWFFFPEHISLMKLDLAMFDYQSKYIFEYLTEYEGRMIFTYGIVVSILLFFRGFGWWERVLAAFAFFAWFKVYWGFWPMALPLKYTVLAILFGYLLLILPRGLARSNPWAGRLAGITLMCVLIYVVFSSLNFFTLRYLLVLLPMLFLFGLGIFYLTVPWKNIVFPVLVVGSVVAFLWPRPTHFNHPSDCDLSYVPAVQLQQKVVDYVTENLPDRNVHIGALYLFRNALSEEGAGFLKGREPFNNLVSYVDYHKNEYWIYANYGMNYEFDGIDTMNLQVVQRFEVDTLWAELLTRR